MPPSPLPASAALLALGLCACTPAHATARAGEFEAARAWAHLEHIVGLGERPAGSAKLEELRRYLEEELTAASLTPQREAFRAETPRGSIEMANVYADLTSAEGARAPLVVLATHIDTKAGLDFPFVGANDGGSGTAVLLELARVLATRARRVDVRFLFLDGEEATRREWRDPDNCYGSRHHVAARAKSGELARMQAMLLLDMVGDRELVLERESSSDAALFARVESAARAAGFGRHFATEPREMKDDHLPFLAAGIPAIDLIDFEYGPGNAWWHTQDDTLDKCSAESLGTAGGIVLAAWNALEEFALERAEVTGKRADAR